MLVGGMVLARLPLQLKSLKNYKIGLSVIAAAGDTFRAGAYKLEAHFENLGFVVFLAKGGDTAAIARDAINLPKQKESMLF